MTTLHLDYETKSDLDLKKVGAHIYAAHPSTSILMLGWAYDDTPVRLWQPHITPRFPAEIREGLTDPRVICEAANAPFERLISYYCLGIPVEYERWVCSLIKAYYLGFAGSLDQVLGQAGLRKKDPRGGQLINRFCKPAPANHNADWYGWETHPKEWADFCGYCVQDVEVERALSHWLDRLPGVPDWDWHQWHIDQRINDRGVPLDVEFARGAIEFWNREREALASTLQQATGLEKVTRDPILAYVNALLASSSLAPFTALNADYIAGRRMRGDLPAQVEKVLDLYAAKEAKAATKYAAALNGAGPDDRARGMFQYKGASRTDRVGGRRIQLQNLKKPVIKKVEEIEPFVDCIKRGDADAIRGQYNVSVSDALGGAVRHVISAPPGKTLAIADYTSIESVLLGWLTNCPLINETFLSGKDSYRVFASQYYATPYDQITKDQRTFCKPPVLGCGYMLGWVGLVKYAEGYGVSMTEYEARRAVDTFREMYPEIKTFWKWLDNAVKYVTRTGAPLSGYRLTIERDTDFLRIRLPSGRNLSYYRPQVVTVPAPWDHTRTVENFAYMGMNDKRQWILDTAHAGGITENVIQSIAVDILWGGIANSYHAGLDIVMHVHDEIGAETYLEHAEWTLQTLIACMVAKPAWAPDLWLGAEGFITPRFTKD